MSGLAFPLLGYALEHALASGVIALLVLALCRTKAAAPGAKAGILLTALMLSVFGPLLPRFDAIGAGPGDALQAGAVPTAHTDHVSRRIEPEAVTPAPRMPGPIRIGESAAMLLIAVWCLGAAWRIAAQAKGYVRLRRIVAASKRSRALETEYRHLLRSDVEIRLCASFGPAVVGALRPKILVPERLAASLPEEAMRAVILHEASHVRRHDLAAHAFQKIVEAVFWWNPAIRWMGASLDVSREIACDIAASRACATPAEYADALLTAIEHAAPPRGVRFASALGMADGLRALDQRIDGIIETHAAPGAASRLAPAAALLCMAAACAAAEAVSHSLAPIPAAPELAAVDTARKDANADRAAVREASVSRLPGSLSTRTADIASAGRIAAKPKTAEARVAQAAEKRTPRLAAEFEPDDAGRIASQADDSYQRTASQSDEEYQRAASQADEEYQHAASQADEDYFAATARADEAYRRRFAALESAPPAAAFEARLARIGRDRSDTVSAASEKYKTRMAEAGKKYRAQMAGANGRYQARMAGAKERYESAMKTARSD